MYLARSLQKPKEIPPSQGAISGGLLGSVNPPLAPRSNKESLQVTMKAKWKNLDFHPHLTIIKKNFLFLFPSIFLEMEVPHAIFTEGHGTVLTNQWGLFV